MATETIDDAVSFLEKINSESEVTVKFRKKDNTMRIMRCTLDFTRIPPDQKPKSVSLQRILKQLRQYGILRVYDLEKSDWRTVPVDRCEWLETDREFYRVAI